MKRLRGRKWRAVRRKQRCGDEMRFGVILIFFLATGEDERDDVVKSRRRRRGGMCRVQCRGQNSLSRWTKESVPVREQPPRVRAWSTGRKNVFSHCVGSSAGFSRPPPTTAH